MQHSIERPLKTNKTNLIVETERAIKLLVTKLIPHYGYQKTETNFQFRQPPQHHTKATKIYYKELEP